MNRPQLFFVFFGVLIQISICTNALCQEYSWKYYSIADGLPQTQITKLYQDSKGYIWIGTKGGLSKFDGVEFENYTLKDNLVNELVEFVHEDSTGKIFIGTRHGLNTYEKGKIVSIPTPIYNDRKSFCVDNFNRIWGTFRDKGVICIEDGKIIENNPLLKYLHKDEHIYLGMFCDKTGDLSFKTSENRFLIWNGSQATIIEKKKEILSVHFSTEGNVFGISKDSLYSYESGRFIPFYHQMETLSVLCIGSKTDIYFRPKKDHSKLYHFDGHTLNEFNQKFNMINCVMVDDQDNLWVGTESGLWRLQSKGFQNYLADPNDNFYTWNVLQDKNGNYWFGSFHNGLKKYDGNIFTDIPVDHLFADGKANNWQYFYSGGLKNRQGDLFFSTVYGVLKYDGSKFSWYYSNHPETIMYIYEDIKESSLLISSAHSGIIEINNLQQAQFHSGRGNRENTGLVTSILKDKYDRIWISGAIGVSIKENGKWRNLPDKKDSIEIGAISMIKDFNQNIWLGSNDGLYFYDYHKLQKVGAATFDRQVGILNITDNNELLIGSIEGMGLLDLNGFYTMNNDTIRYFDSNNGFLGTECKHNASFKDRDGNIWICASDRVVKVNPKKLISNPNPPRVYIKNISTISENMEWQPLFDVINESNSFVLEPDEEDTRFYYQGISHSAPEGVKYQTMLEGYDNEWSAITTERYRTYTNLPHGTYTFKVKAANIDGVWSDDTAKVRFAIRPAWHELASVRFGGLFFIIITAGGIGYLYSERQKRIKQHKIRNEKRIAKLQFNSLKSLIDPHFTFNAINSIASMVYQENRDEAYHYFTKFSKLIRTAFDNSEHTTRTINDEIQFVKNYLDIEKMRFKDRFDYKIVADKRINSDWKIPKMIIQIYVENAIKHGLVYKESGGYLEIRLKLEKDNLVVVVKDNGVGRNHSETFKDRSKSLGSGTKIMSKYFKLLNSFNDQKIWTKTTDLIDQNGISTGTEVIVSLPLSFKYTF